MDSAQYHHLMHQNLSGIYKMISDLTDFFQKKYRSIAFLD